MAPANGNFKYLSSSSIPNVGSGVEFSCNSNYRLVGSSVITCLASGQWSAKTPTCQGKQKQKLTNHSLHCMLDVDTCGLQAHIYNACTGGESYLYDASPSNTVTWLPTCKAVHINGRQCISPKWLHTFKRQLQQLQYWHTCCTYTCLRFFHTLSGMYSCKRFCVAAFFPSEILCPEPNAPRNGNFEYLTSPATPRVGSRVRYSCSNVLYRLVGDSTVTCLATGEWSARTPTCRLTFSWFG